VATSLPSLESLRCFLEVARLSSFRAAGKVMGLTPAAVGQRIQKLEAELGVRLFQRTTRSVVLTEPALALLPHAREAIDATTRCLSAARGEIGPPLFEVVLGTRHELGQSWIVPMLPKLRAKHPGVTLHLYFGSGPDLLLRTRTVEIDCAVTSSRLTDPKLASAGLHEERYVFLGERRLLQSLPFRKPEDARRHTLLDISAELPLFSYLNTVPAVGTFNFGTILRMGTIATIRSLVLRGEGLAVLPEYYVRRDLAQRRLVRIMPRVPLSSDQFRLVYRTDDPRAALYAALAKTLRSEPLR
jgi:LysR family transcriptional regulator, glycine cleavage system transcriptional activator